MASARSHPRPSRISDYLLATRGRRRARLRGL